MSENQGYNGWVNYETWCVNLHMDNDANSQGYWLDVARDSYAEASADTSFTRQQRASIELANVLKSEFEESMPYVGAASVWDDMLNAAFGAVNWDEIARSWVQKIVDEIAYEASNPNG